MHRFQAAATEALEGMNSNLSEGRPSKQKKSIPAGKKSTVKTSLPKGSLAPN